MTVSADKTGLATGRGGALEGLLWLAQRLSAVLLVAGLSAHLAAIHLTPQPGLNFAAVTSRLASPGWRLFEAAFLVVVTFHALGGLWLIVCDYVESPALRRVLAACLVALGALLVAVGGWSLASVPWAGAGA
jgi:succinate dehydrogenase / fumarate reductase membrane anchor subunit